MAWNYQREEATFDAIPEGDYRCRIASAEKAISQSGNDMLVLKLEISGYASHVWYYIPFLEDRPQITNRMLTQMFDCFAIEEGNFTISSYAGKVGACKIKHDEQGRAKISVLYKSGSKDSLPPFVSVSNSQTSAAPEIAPDGFMPVPEDKLPF